MDNHINDRIGTRKSSVHLEQSTIKNIKYHSVINGVRDSPERASVCKYGI